VTISQVLLIFETSAGLKNINELFSKRSLIGIGLMILSLLDKDYGFGERGKER
jgi:hypothetical protein